MEKKRCGRPPGAKNKNTDPRLILRKSGEKMAGKLVDLAMSGNTDAMKLAFSLIGQSHTGNLRIYDPVLPDIN